MQPQESEVLRIQYLRVSNDILRDGPHVPRTKRLSNSAHLCSACRQGVEVCCRRETAPFLTGKQDPRHGRRRRSAGQRAGGQQPAGRRRWRRQRLRGRVAAPRSSKHRGAGRRLKRCRGYGGCRHRDSGGCVEVVDGERGQSRWTCSRNRLAEVEKANERVKVSGWEEGKVGWIDALRDHESSGQGVMTEKKKRGRGGDSEERLE